MENRLGAAVVHRASFSMRLFHMRLFLMIFRMFRRWRSVMVLFVMMLFGLGRLSRGAAKRVLYCSEPTVVVCHAVDSSSL
jgi:hypothetical protein